MISHVFDVPLHKGDYSTEIFFWGDEQEGSEGFDPKGEAWQAFKADWKRSKNPYAIGMGDYSDWLRPTMRDSLGASLIKDFSAKRQLDNMVRDNLEKTAERLEFMKGRIIGMHEGHHDYEMLGGITSTMILAESLKTINLGWVAGTRLNLTIPNHGSAYAFTIASTHGNASGRETGAVANSMQQSMKDFVCDLKVAGHACRSANWTPHNYRIIKRRGSAGMVEISPRHLLVGGFCNSYTNGWISMPKDDVESGRKIGGRPQSGYAERRNLTPQPLMWGVARIAVVHSANAQRSRGNNPGTPMVDVETVNRGPAVSSDGSW